MQAVLNKPIMEIARYVRNRLTRDVALQVLYNPSVMIDKHLSQPQWLDNSRRTWFFILFCAAFSTLLLNETPALFSLITSVVVVFYYVACCMFGRLFLRLCCWICRLDDDPDVIGHLFRLAMLPLPYLLVPAILLQLVVDIPLLDIEHARGNIQHSGAIRYWIMMCHLLAVLLQLRCCYVFILAMHRWHRCSWQRSVVLWVLCSSPIWMIALWQLSLWLGRFG